MGNRWGNSGRLFLGGFKITADGDWSHEIKRYLLLGRKAMTKEHSILKNRGITLPTKVHLLKAMVFPVVMYGCENWTIKKAECRRIDALEKTPESPLDCKEIKPVNPNGNKSWIFFGRTDVEAETPIVWPPDVKNWLIWKDPVSGKEWRQEEMVMTEDEMVRWHQRLNGHEFEQALGVCDGQRSLTCSVHGVTSCQTWLSDWTIENILNSVAQSCPTLCDPMNCSTLGLPVHHQLSEFTQTHVHRDGDAIQPSHPLSSPSPPAPNPSQHQSLFQWVNSSHEVAKVLEFQSQYQSFQWTPRTDLLQNGLVGSPFSSRDSQESSPTPQFKSINSLVLSFLHRPTLTSIHDHRKNQSLD